MMKMGYVRWLSLGVVLAAAPLRAAEYDCVTEPSQTVAVRAAVEGLIATIAVDRGDAVKRGQILVTLESGFEAASAELAQFRAKMQGAVHSSESRVDYAQIKANRNVQLQQENFISAEERDEAQTALKLAESELEETRDNRRVAELEYRRAKEELERRTVRSPLDGVVIERLMQPGELADNQNRDRPILKLANTRVLHVEALLPLEAYRGVRPGMSARVMPEAPVGGTYTAAVTVVDSVVDAASGTFGVRLALPNPEQQVPAGVKCRVVFDLAPTR
jgi:RND family efflux transporter MFP subunit